MVCIIFRKTVEIIADLSSAQFVVFRLRFCYFLETALLLWLVLISGVWNLPSEPWVAFKENKKQYWTEWRMYQNTSCVCSLTFASIFLFFIF